MALVETITVTVVVAQVDKKDKTASVANTVAAAQALGIVVILV